MIYIARTFAQDALFTISLYSSTRRGNNKLRQTKSDALLDGPVPRSARSRGDTSATLRVKTHRAASNELDVAEYGEYIEFPAVFAGEGALSSSRSIPAGTATVAAAEEERKRTFGSGGIVSVLLLRAC